MTTVYRATKSGLVVPERVGDEAAMQRALKAIDRDLRLVWEVDEKFGSQVWKVYCWTGDDREAVHVLDWRDEDGTPRPLTSGLLDAVNMQRRDRPGGYDALAASDAANAALKARRQKEAADRLEAVRDEFAPFVDGNRVSSGFADTRPLPRYLRNRHLPERVREQLR